MAGYVLQGALPAPLEVHDLLSFRYIYPTLYLRFPYIYLYKEHQIVGDHMDL